MFGLLIYFLIFCNSVFSYQQISHSVELLIDHHPDQIETFLIHFQHVFHKKNKGKKHRVKVSNQDILRRHMQQVKAAQSKFETDHLLLLEEYQMKSLWVSNSLRLTCPVSFIEKIFKRNDIRYIQLDSPVYLPKIIESQILEEQEIDKVSEGLKHLRINKLRTSHGLNLLGENTKIGLIDTAFDSDRFNLEQITSKDFTSNKSHLEANTKHGTYSLGILIGSKDGRAHTAIAPKAHIYHAKVFHDNDRSTIS
ncbi:S8 family serine peptidase, partial [bacterium]|nr:S8 family serine peptidase [bacterium]